MTRKKFQLPPRPMEKKGEVRDFCTQFSNTAKRVVSHLELQAWLSSVGFSMYGPDIRMRRIEQLDFPSPLLRGQHIELRLKLISERRINGYNTWFVTIDVRAVGVEKKLPVMVGRVVIVAGEV